MRKGNKSWMKECIEEMEDKQVDVRKIAQMLPKGKPILIEVATTSSQEDFTRYATHFESHGAEHCAPRRHLTFTTFSFYFGITKESMTKAANPSDVLEKGIYYNELGRNVYELKNSLYEHHAFRENVHIYGMLGAKELHSVRISASVTDSSRTNIYTSMDNIAEIMIRHSELEDVIGAFNKLNISLPERIEKQAQQKSIEILHSLSRELISSKEGSISQEAANLLIMAQRIGVEKYVSEIEPHPGIKIDVKRLLEGMKRENGQKAKVVKSA